MPGPSSSCVPWSTTPPGAYRPSPISRCGRCCLQAISYLGHPETFSFRGYLPTAHSLACLRFAESVTVSGARLATGRAGSPLAGRVSHPLDDKQGFMKSSHTPFPLDQPCLVAREIEMISKKLRLQDWLITISAAAALALAGCGGGGTSMPDDDTMVVDKVQPLTIPAGLAQSTATPIHATDADDTLAALLPNPANLFAPLLSMFSGDPSEPSPSSVLTSDIRVTTVRSDGDNGFHVTYEVGSEEQTIHFEAGDYLDGQHYYFKTIDGVGYFLGTETGSFERTDKNQGSSRFAYFDVNTFGDFDETTDATDRNHFVYGARTDAANLPAGSATYIGGMHVQTYPTDDPSNNDRNRMEGSMRLTADFDESTLEGMVFGIRVTKTGENAPSRLSDTAHFAIGNGRIVDGQFTAALTGADSNENASMDETVRGYEGNVLGQFYGPGAEEVGAVLNATRSDRVLYGWLGGRQSDPNLPSGLHRSSADPVFAMRGGGDIEDLFDAGTQFAPLSSALDQNRPERSVEPTGDAYVKSFALEANDVFRVTYSVGGKELTILYQPTEFTEDGDYSYWERGGDDSVGSYFGFSGGGDYYDTGGFHVWHQGESERFTWTTGARTNATDLPAGTATYVGYMGAENFSQVDPSIAVRYSLRGDLSLTADFDASTLEGEITNIGKRWREPTPRVWMDLPDTTSFDISDGQIADGQFTATLTGADTNESAPLHDSVRGYEGDVLGEFYGPAAEEVGGVISATRDEDLRVMTGTIHGEKQ